MSELDASLAGHASARSLPVTPTTSTHLGWQTPVTMSTSALNLVCQQCKQPLTLDESLLDLSSSDLDLIASTLPTPSAKAARWSHLTEDEKLAMVPAPETVKQAWKRTAHPHVPPVEPLPSTSSDALGRRVRRPSFGRPNESYVFLQDSVVQKIPSQPSSPARNQKKLVSPKGKEREIGKQTTKPVPQQSSSKETSQAPLSHHLRSTMRLFNLLSSRTDIDHPLCTECTHILLSNLSRQVEELKKERDGYLAFEKEAKKEKEKDDGVSREETERQIEKLKEREKIAIEELREAQRDKERLDEEWKALEAEEKELEKAEAEFWTAHNAHLLKADKQRQQLASVRNQYASDATVLDRLERTNVYNDAFCIGHEGVFGTINGLRLGRVGGVTVEWNEINAAWGQTLLLLYTMARKLEFTFENYRLVPMGSFSRIEKTGGDKSVYELYGSGDLHLGRLLHNRRFDFAMVAFLDCLRQMIDYVKSQDASVDFPHQIVKDKIGDVSIKLQFGVEEAWTRALRHVLLALKILLKWATSSAS